jgi:hypothetical protein
MASIPGSMLNMENIIKKVFDHTTDSLRTTSGGAFTVTIDASDDSIAIGDRITGDLMTVNPDGSINTNIMGVTPVLGRIPVDLGAAVVNITGPVTIPGEVEIGNDSGNPIPISALSLPLPIGASTSALQTTGNASLASIDSKLTSPIAVTGPLTNTQLRATPVPVSTTSLPLPTGAATLTEQQAQTNILTTIESYTQVVSGTTYSTIAAAGTNIGAASVDQLVGGVYKQTPPTLTDGDQSEIILNSKGHQIVEVSNSLTGEFSLTQDTIDEIKPLDVQPTVMPTVTATTGTIGPDPGVDFVKIGGFDVDNNEYREAVFNGEALVVSDSTNASISSGIATNTSNTATSVNSIDIKTPNLGQAPMITSTPVVIASNQSTIPTKTEDGQLFTQTLATPAINTNLMTGVVSTTGWIDAKGMNSVSFSIRGSVASGTFAVEQTGDPAQTSGIVLPVQNSASTSLATSVSAIGIGTTETIYNFPIMAQYFRIRMASASTGTVNTRTITKQAPFTTNSVFVGGGSSTVTVASGTITTVSSVTGVTAANLAIPGRIQDTTLAAVTTTTTTAGVTPTFGTTFQLVLNISAVSGTLPTYDLGIEQSYDGGVSWTRIYDMPRITTTGQYFTPEFAAVGQVRYVQTISGTTPSFTRQIQRLQGSGSLSSRISQIINRSVVLTTPNATTPSLRVHNASNVQLVFNVGAIVTTPPELQLEGSDDMGASWYVLGTPLTAVASSTVQVTIVDVQTQLIRARVSTAGVGVTPGYVLLKGF